METDDIIVIMHVFFIFLFISSCEVATYFFYLLSLILTLSSLIYTTFDPMFSNFFIILILLFFQLLFVDLFLLFYWKDSYKYKWLSTGSHNFRIHIHKMELLFFFYKKKH